MKVVIIAPALWHAPDVAAGLRALGQEVEIVGAAQRHPLAAFPLKAIRGLSVRISSVQPVINFGLGALATALADCNAVILAWSSFALAAELQQANRVIVVRGSHHVRRQSEMLADDPLARQPSKGIVKLEEREYRRALVVTVPTAAIAQDAYWTAGGARPPIVTPYGFPQVPARSQRGSEHRPSRLIFGGFLDYRKGIDRLASALESRPSHVSRFDLFGPVPRRTGGLPNWWSIHGLVTRSAWLEALTSAGILLLPSREEGMARVGQEALAHGVPVIATPEAGLTQWLQQGAGVELRAADWEDGLSHALAVVNDQWTSFSSAALAVARSWTWRHHAELLLNQINEATR